MFNTSVVSIYAWVKINSRQRQIVERDKQTLSIPCGIFVLLIYKRYSKGLETVFNMVHSFSKYLVTLAVVIGLDFIGTSTQV